MTVVAVTIVYVLFSIFEIVSLVKTKQKKELITYCVLLCIAYTISILLVCDVKIPSVKRLVGDLIMPLTKE